MGATDFFTVEVWTLRGLVRYHVLFVIRFSSRKVNIAGIVPEPDGEWMKQVALNLADCMDGFRLGCRFLIHDRSTLFTKEFQMILGSAGVNSVRLPPRSPNLNAFAEMFVRSIKEECLERMIFFSERQLRLLVREYVEHHHGERNHQGLGNRLLEPSPPADPDVPMRRRRRVGGLLNYYHREAA